VQRTLQFSGLSHEFVELLHARYSRLVEGPPVGLEADKCRHELSVLHSGDEYRWDAAVDEVRSRMLKDHGVFADWYAQPDALPDIRMWYNTLRRD
jgi:hypothetical protein